MPANVFAAGGVKMKILACALLIGWSCLAGAAERGIDAEATVNAGIDAVWQAWTTTDGIKTFFAPDGRVELGVDGPFEIYFDPLAEPGLRGADGMRILAFQAPTMLSFTWNAPPHLAQARKQRTHVTVRLELAGTGQTRVSLRHVGWGTGGEWDQTYAYFSKSWPAVLANLKQRFDKGPMDWQPWMDQLRKMHARPR